VLFHDSMKVDDSGLPQGRLLIATRMKPGSEPNLEDMFGCRCLMTASANHLWSARRRATIPAGVQNDRPAFLQKIPSQ
jgi:hypothetical protein